MDPNLTNPTIISESKEQEVDKNPWKLLSLLLVGAVLSVWMTYLFQWSLLNVGYGYLLASFLVAGGFLAIVILETFFIKGRMKLWGILLIQGIAPLLLFYREMLNHFSEVLFIGTGLALFLMIAGAMRGYRTLSETMKIRFFEVARVTTGKVATGLALFLSVVLYVNYFELGKFTEAMGRQFVDHALQSSEPVVRLWFPNVSFNQPVRTFLEQIVEEQLRKAKLNVVEGSQTDFQGDITKLPASVKSQIVEQGAERLQKILEQSIGAFNPNTPISDVVYNRIKSFIERLSGSTYFGAGIGITLLIFITIKGIFALFYWLVWFVAFLLFKLFLTVDFARISIQTRRREFVVLD